MFIGHDACSFGAKRVAPQMSLGLLIAAPNLLDLLWPIFLLLGIEHVRIQQGPTPFLNLDFYDYPWSHSLAMSIVWGALFAIGYHLFTRDTRGAIVGGVLVVIYIASLIGPPPPSARIVAWSALLLWILPLWGFWIDRR